MNIAGKILSIEPKYVIPGGEVQINCEGLQIKDFSSFGCYFNGVKARIIGSATNKVLATVPNDLDVTDVDVVFENNGEKSEPFQIKVGKLLTDNLHLVSNPAIDPNDDSIILTRSGSRGQNLPVTLFRLDTDGYLSEISADVMNPTGLAFNQHGKLFITNRADGEVLQLNNDNEVVPVETDLGIATGIAFDKQGNLYVGDRSGKIYKIAEMGTSENWAILEPSVSAYHLAFGLDGDLYITAPGLCSYDSVYRIDEEGLDSTFYKGLGRPQGLAFDDVGNLYVAACLEGKHGIVKISDNGNEIEHFISGTGIVGLCFTRKGEMIVATSDAVYSLNLGIYGILLD